MLEDRLVASIRLLFFVAAIAAVALVALESCRPSVGGFVEIEERGEEWCPTAYPDQSVRAEVITRWGSSQRCEYFDADGQSLGTRPIQRPEPRG